MGLAVIIQGADFSSENIGQVTFLKEVDVTGITINANSSYTGVSAQLSATYEPFNTNQKGVTWEIISGGSYARIHANTGLLTILEGANASQVTVKATSTFNPSITATKTIAVTYKETVDELTGISINAPATITGRTAALSVVYNPVNTSMMGVKWKITSGGSYASINADTGVLTILEGANASQVTVEATSVHDNSINATKTITITYSLPYFDLDGNMLVIPVNVPDGFIASNASILIEFDTVGGVIYGNTTEKAILFGDYGAGAKGYISIESEYYGNFRVRSDADTTGGNFKNSYACQLNKINFQSGSKLKKLYYSPHSITGSDFSGRGGSYELEASQMGGTIVPNGYFTMNFSAVADKVNTLDELKSYMGSIEDFTAAIENGNLKISNQTGHLTTLIVIPNYSATSEADLIAHRGDAMIDIQFNSAGEPYNAATAYANGDVMFARK